MKSGSLLRFVISSLLGLFLLVGLLWYVGVGRLLVLLGRLSLVWLLVSFASLTASFVLRGVRWRLMLSPVKSSVRISDATGLIVISLFVNELIPIRAGEVLRALLLKRREDVNFFTGFSSIVVERILDLAVIVGWALFALYFLPLNSNSPEWFMGSLRVTSLFVLVVLAVFIVSTRREEATLNIVRRVVSKLTIFPERWRLKLLDYAKSFIVGARGVSYSVPLLVGIVGLSVIVWLLQFAVLYSLFLAVGLGVRFEVVLLGTMVFTILSILPAPPSRVGSFEALWSLTFVGLGITLDEALSVGLIAHLFILLFHVVLGSVCVVWLGVGVRSIFQIGREKPV